MQDYSRFTINRYLIVLLPKQPALDWIMRVDPNPPELTLAELRQEQDAFLVHQEGMELVEDAERWVYRRWKMFFERFLGEWYTDESWWPKNRTQKMFKEWFDSKRPTRPHRQVRAQVVVSERSGSSSSIRLLGQVGNVSSVCLSQA